MAESGGGTTAYEAMLERKRQAMRRALKYEYVKMIQDPRRVREPGLFFDAAAFRYNAMKFTMGEFKRYTPKTVAMLTFGYVIPVLGIPYAMHRYKMSIEDDTRAGNVPYDHPRRRRMYNI